MPIEQREKKRREEKRRAKVRETQSVRRRASEKKMSLMRHAQQSLKKKETPSIEGGPCCQQLYFRFFAPSPLSMETSDTPAATGERMGAQIPPAAAPLNAAKKGRRKRENGTDDDDAIIAAALLGRFVLSAEEVSAFLSVFYFLETKHSRLIAPGVIADQKRAQARRQHEEYETAILLKKKKNSLSQPSSQPPLSRPRPSPPPSTSLPSPPCSQNSSPRPRGPPESPPPATASGPRLWAPRVVFLSERTWSCRGRHWRSRCTPSSLSSRWPRNRGREV